MLLVYGSTGYIGRLIVAEALARGLRPTLAARNVEAVRTQAQSPGLEWRAASIDNPALLDAALDGATVDVLVRLSAGATVVITAPPPSPSSPAPRARRP
jgi:uncharacterized protein YbjT (DUF2867 family)